MNAPASVALAGLCLGLAATPVVRAAAPPADAVNVAVTRGLERIVAGVTRYTDHRVCFSCHHQAMAVLSLTEARRRGFSVDPAVLDRQTDLTLGHFPQKAVISRGEGLRGGNTTAGYALAALAAAGHPADDTVLALVDYLLVRQRKDGAWMLMRGSDRPPSMGSLFTNTALALSALRTYSPAGGTKGGEERQRQIDSAVGKGRDWLLANRPVSTEDKVFHLRGLVSAGVAGRVIAEARERLVGEQLADGSWAQLSGTAGDAYATGTVLTALRQAGLGATHEAYRKGVRYLLDTQTKEGAWIVRTRSVPVQVFFDNGDPGGKSQFISFAATNWAVLALLGTVPVR